MDRDSERNRKVATAVTTEGSNARSNNFTSDFENVSPYMDEHGFPQPMSSANSAGQTNNNNKNNRAPSGHSSVSHPNGAPQDTANTHPSGATDAAGFSLNMLALPKGPISVDHVNWLLSACGITQERAIDSLRQCSSSLFALLFQRIFNCTIKNLELEPNTQEKRLWNIERVLDELQTFVNTDLSHISAERIVALDEEHISELIRVFFEIVVSFVAATTTSQQQQQQREREALATGGGVGGGGPSAAGGEGAGLLSGHLLPDDDESQVDSTHKTQRLVSNWKREVVHPLRDLDGGLGGLGSVYSASTSTYRLDGDGSATPTARGSRRDIGLPPRGRSGSRTTTGKAPTTDSTGPSRQLTSAPMSEIRGRLQKLDKLLLVAAPSADHMGGKSCTTKQRAEQTAASDKGKRTKKSRGSSQQQQGRGDGNDTTTAQHQQARTVAPSTYRGAIIGTRSGSSRGDKTAEFRGGGALAVLGGNRSTLKAKGDRTHRDPYLLADSGAMFPPSTYSLAKTIDTEARDIKIEQLKTLRFMSDVQQRMRATIVNKASEEQAEIAGTVKSQQARVRADTRDMLKYAREENEKYKKAYEAILMSARNDVARFRDIVDPRTVQIYDRNTRATRSASAGVKAAIKQQREVEDRRVERYYSAITTWRHGTVACF